MAHLGLPWRAQLVWNWLLPPAGTFLAAPASRGAPHPRQGPVYANYTLLHIVYYILYIIHCICILYTHIHIYILFPQQDPLYSVHKLCRAMYIQIYMYTKELK